MGLHLQKGHFVVFSVLDLGRALPENMCAHWIIANFRKKQSISGDKQTFQKKKFISRDKKTIFS